MRLTCDAPTGNYNPFLGRGPNAIIDGMLRNARRRISRLDSPAARAEALAVESAPISDCTRSHTDLRTRARRGLRALASEMCASAPHESPTEASDLLCATLPPECAEACGNLVRPDKYMVTPHGVEKKEEYQDKQGNQRTRLLPISHNPFWIIREVIADDGWDLEIAALVRGRIRRFVIARKLLHDRALASVLDSQGVTIAHDAGYLASEYMIELLTKNAANLPQVSARWQTGWDETFATFMLGNECIGGPNTIQLHRLEEDQAATRFVGAIGTRGSPEVWRKTVEATMRVAPHAALMVAAALASPMLRLFQWPVLSVMLAAIGGKNKSTLLRVGASVFGATGTAAERQPGGLVGTAMGTTKGLLLQERRMSDLPHFIDELKVNTANPRAVVEAAMVLHQLADGQEHVRATRASTGTKIGLRFVGCNVVAGETASEEVLAQQGVIRRYMPPKPPYGDEPLGRYTSALCDNFGHLGRAVVERLVAADSVTRERLKGMHADAQRRMDEVIADLDLAERDAEHIRSWGQQMATALAAVDVAAELCPEYLPDPALMGDSLLGLWSELARSRGDTGVGRDIVAEAREHIIGFVAASRSRLEPSRARLQAVKRRLPQLKGFDAADRAEEMRIRDETRPIKDPIGRIVEAYQEGEDGEQLRVVDILQRGLTEYLAGRGLSMGTLSRQLVQAGVLRPDDVTRDQGGSSRRSTVGGTNARVYRVVLPQEAAEHRVDAGAAVSSGAGARDRVAGDDDTLEAEGDLFGAGREPYRA